MGCNGARPKSTPATRRTASVVIESKLLYAAGRGTKGAFVALSRNSTFERDSLAVQGRAIVSDSPHHCEIGWPACD